jgi:hypothetical protein
MTSLFSRTFNRTDKVNYLFLVIFVLLIGVNSVTMIF